MHVRVRLSTSSRASVRPAPSRPASAATGTASAEATASVRNSTWAILRRRRRAASSSCGRGRGHRTRCQAGISAGGPSRSPGAPGGDDESSDHVTMSWSVDALNSLSPENLFVTLLKKLLCLLLVSNSTREHFKGISNTHAWSLTVTNAHTLRSALCFRTPVEPNFCNWSDRFLPSTPVQYSGMKGYLCFVLK